MSSGTKHNRAATQYGAGLLVPALPSLALLLCPAVVPAQVTSLAPDVTLQGSLEPGSVERFTTAIAEGDYAVVEVRQKGVDAVVRLSDPSGRIRTRADLPTGRAGTERVTWIGDVEGAWVVEVSPSPDALSGGAFEVEWVIRRPGSEADRLAVAADALFAEAAALHTSGDLVRAEQLYREAIGILDTSPEPRPLERSRILHMLGLAAWDLAQLDDAEAALGAALSSARTAFSPTDPEVAAPMASLATYYDQVGRHDLAEPLLLECVSLLTEALGPDDLDTVAALNNLATYYHLMGRWAEAEDLYGRVIDVRTSRLTANHPDVAMALGNAGMLLHDQGRLADAESRYLRAVRVLEATGAGEADLIYPLTNLASLHADQGRYAEAELLLRRVLRILRETYPSDHPEVAMGLQNLASLRQLQGRSAEAEPLLGEALEVLEASYGREHADVALVLDNLGLLAVSAGGLAEAEDYHRQAADILQAIDSAHPDLALTLDHVGLALVDQQRYPEAEPLFRRALALLEEGAGADHPDVALVLNGMALTLMRQRRWSEASDLLDRSVAILDGTLAYPEDRIRAYALRADVRRELEDPAALDDLELALRLAEEQRPNVSGGEEARARFFAGYAPLYDRMVAWQLQEGAVEDAFEYTERGRARVLLDQLAAGRVDLRSSIPGDMRTEIEAREDRARASLAEYQTRLAVTRSRSDLEDGERAVMLTALTDSLQAADRAYRQAYEEVKTASPLWRDLITTGGRPVSVGDVERAVLRPGSIMLLYQVGDEESALFVITAGSGATEVFELSVDAEVAARLGLEQGPVTSEGLRRVLEGSGPDGRRSPVLEGLRTAGLSRGTEIAGPGAGRPLEALWHMLVPAQIWDRLVAADEVVIVPDGSLHKLPFEALQLGVDAEGAARFWLDEGPVIRYAASATVLYNIGRRPLTRPSPLGGTPALVTVSNPVFDPVEVAASGGSGGSPVAGAGLAPSETLADLNRSAYTARGGTLERLPGTQRESDEIGRAFASAGDPAGVLTLSGLDATEERVRDAIESKRFLHLATHGLVDEGRGSLFASLALTPPPEGGGDPRQRRVVATTRDLRGSPHGNRARRTVGL